MGRSHRVPNPPSVFLGRDRELAWTRAALARGTVVVLAGPAGIGKTALALKAIADPSVKDAPALQVASVAREPAEQTTLEVVRALAAALGRDLELAPLQASSDARLDMALELASEWGGLVLVDGLATHEEEAERWLEGIDAYAKNAHFVVTARDAPTADRLSGQSLTLGPLDPAASRELALAWAPEAEGDLRSRAVRQSRGRPGALLATLRGRKANAIGAGTRELLGMLQAIGQAVPEEVLHALGSSSAVEELKEADLLVQVGDRFEPWAAHETTLPTSHALEGAATSLVLLGHTEATLAAIGLLARAGRYVRLNALLEERGETLLREGYAARLWSALGDLATSELEAWQLRCAAQLGNPTVLAHAHEPAGADPEDRLAWARTLLARGKPNEARAAVRPVQEAGGASAVEAACLAAEAAARGGDLDATRSILTEVEEPADVASGTHLRVARARWAAERGDADPTRELGSLVRELERVDAPEEAWRALAETLARRGELDAALEALDALESRPRGKQPELLTSRAALLTRAAIAVERGEPDLARELLDVVRPFAREPSALAAPLAACELEARLLEGRLAGFESQLALAFERSRNRDALATKRLEALEALYRLAHGHAPPEGETTAQVAYWRARWGQPADAQIKEGGDRRVSVTHAMNLAAAALARGEVTAAFAAAERAVAEADRWGLTSLGLAALVVCAEARSSDPRALKEIAKDLLERAKRCRSHRYERYARFFAAIATGRLDPATAEALAADPNVAPTVSRWCRAALGGTPPLDAADRVLLESLRSSGALPQVTCIGDAQERWSPAWGLDQTERSVWLPNGERVALGSRPTQWKVLECLALSPGLAADKETLVKHAWEVTEYHPGRHDGRLYVSIRKLRAVLEEDPSEPARLVTTEDGYALGQPVRLAG